MIFCTATVEVNPKGEVALTREQLWAGLVLKARDAREFLPPGVCTRCDVVAEGRDFIVRDATIFGDDLTEVVTFRPHSKVSFHQASGPREGVIVNEILQGAEGALMLRFYSYLGLPGGAPGGEEERREQARLESSEKGYPAALRATVARTRQLVGDGRL